MGAIIAGGIAMGWSDQELDWRIRKAFVDSNPLSDIAFPLVAMTKGLQVRRRLKEHFGEAEIPDLWLPYLCVSSDLTSGSYHLHRRGLLRRALQAIGGPARHPASGHRRRPRAGRRGDHQELPHRRDALHAPRPDSWRRRGRGARPHRRGHRASRLGLALVRLGRLAARPAHRLDPDAHGHGHHRPRAGRRQGLCRCLHRARTSGPIEIRDWKAYEPAVEAGYRATVECLAKLDKPITEVRRRTTLEERRQVDRGASGESVRGFAARTRP